MKIKAVTQALTDYFASNVFWLKIMLKSCVWTGIFYVSIQFVIQLSPLVTVWLWKLLIDEFESIYTTGQHDIYVWIVIFAYIVVKFINSLLLDASSVLEEKIYRKSRYTMNHTIIEKMAHLDAAFFSNPENADLTKAAKSSEIYFAKRIPEEVSIVIKIVAFITMLITFLAYYPLGGFLFLLTYIPGAINSYSYKKKMDQYSINKIPEERKRNYYKSILTGANYAKDLRLYNLSAFMRSKYDKLTLKIRTERAKLFKNNTIVSFLLSLLTYSGVSTVIVLSVLSVIRGNMTIGMMTLYVGLAKSTGESFQNIIVGLAFSLTQTSNEYKRYMKFINYKIKTRETTSINIVGSPSIEFKNVFFRYPGCDEYAIDDLSFKIDSEKKVALIGVNGAGKSTVVKLLLRFYDPEHGKILINGYDIREYSTKELHKVFSVCLQNVCIYSMTLRENIAISDTDRINDMESVLSAACESGIDKLAEILPNEYESKINLDFYSDGIELSGGQKQKIALSRAYFKQSGFIILDEPSSSLDPIAEDQVFSSFGKVCRNRGGILISHRLSNIMMVDEILLLESGRIVEKGTHDELMALNRKYAEMYNMQAEKYRKAE